MMKLFLIFALLLGFACCVHGQSLESQIKQANTIWMSNFAAGNGSAVAECYSTDAKLLPTGSEVITGRDGIGSFFTGAMGAGVSTVLLQTDEVGYLDSLSQWAFERGHYFFYNAQGAQIDVGKYVVIWTQINGNWYLYNDIFNSNISPKSTVTHGIVVPHRHVHLQGVADDIAKANQVWMNNFKTGNGSLVAQCYATNAKLLPTGTDVLSGQPAIGAFFQGAMKAVATVKLATDEVGPSDATTWAFERGHYTFYNTQGTQIDYGKYVVVWVNLFGNWYLYNDIFNTNTPTKAVFIED